MSGKGFIATESPRRCQLCGVTAETRPYGPEGEHVCFECGMKDEDAARFHFQRRVQNERIEEGTP